MVKKLASLIDARDVVFIIAILMVFWGLWFVYWPLSLIVTGVLLFAIVLVPELRRKEK